MGSHLNVQFADASINASKEEYATSAEAFQATVAGMKASTNGLPSLIFLFSDEEIPPPAKAKNAQAKPTPQALDSAGAWEELFQTEGDFSVFIPGRFFNIVRADATRVKDSDNRYACSKKAPIVILTDKAGQVKASFEGRARIKRSAVVDAMVDILKKDGFIQSATQFAKLNALMTDLEKIEIDLAFAKERVDKVQDTLGEAKAKDAVKARKAEAKGREAKTSTTATAAEENLEKVNALVKERNTTKYEILKQEYDLLVDLKLPTARMPPEPKKP